MLTRAYSVLHVKSVDSERRIITGVATTPETDRAGDIVEPLGVTYAKRLPLLLYHDSRQPVGTVAFQTPTKKGITFEASIPEIAEPGALKNRVDEAWQSVKAGLIAGVSIGFRALEDGIEVMKTGGIRFLKTEVLELSLVAIPANASAVIQTIKSLDTGLAAPGNESVVDSPTPQQSAGVSAPTRVVKLMTPQDRTMPKPITDQIRSFEATRQSKQAEQDAIIDKSADEGVTLDAEQKEQYDTLTGELKELDEHIVRLRAREKANESATKEVKGATSDDATATRTNRPVITVKEQELPPGYEFARMVQCKMLSFLEFQKGNIISAMDVAKQRFPDNPRIQQYIQYKSAVTGGTTTDSTFAAALLAPAQVLESSFLDYLRPQTIVGKFGANGIPSLQRVPFNVKIQSQTTGGTAGWVGEGKAKPVTKFAYTDATMLFTKIAAISVITEELARFSSPGAEGLVRDALAKAVIERMDRDFIDPDIAAVSAVKPASITNGVTALTSAGTSAANVLTDMQNLLETYILANVDPANLVLIMPSTLAMVLALTQNSLGQPAFPNLTMRGGSLVGIPVITSQYAAMGSSYGNMVIAVNASDIALADDGQVTVDVSREASIQMDDAPSQDATAGTGSTSVSMWQTNSLAVRAERTINWKKLRTSAVAYLDDVNWGSIGSPF